MQQQTPEALDLAGMAADLNSLLRLKTTVIGIKMFARVEEMAAIPKIRRPSAVHTTDQIVSMASRLGWTVGITADDLVGAQCRAVIGLAPQDEKWLEGQNYVGVWHGTAEDARKRRGCCGAERRRQAASRRVSLFGVTSCVAPSVRIRCV